jgi:hypothetical protein
LGIDTTKLSNQFRPQDSFHQSKEASTTYQNLDNCLFSNIDMQSTCDIGYNMDLIVAVDNSCNLKNIMNNVCKVYYNFVSTLIRKIHDFNYVRLAYIIYNEIPNVIFDFESEYNNIENSTDLFQLISEGVCENSNSNLKNVLKKSIELFKTK